VTPKYIIILIMSVTRKYFRSCFFSFLERQDVKLSVHTCWEKNVVLNIVFVKIILHLLLCSLPSVAFPFILKLSLM